MAEDENPLVKAWHTWHIAEKCLHLAGISVPVVFAYVKSAVTDFNHAIYDTLPLVIAAGVVAFSVRRKASPNSAGYFVVGTVVLVAAAFATDLLESDLATAFEKLVATTGNRPLSSVYQAYIARYD